MAGRVHLTGEDLARPAMDIPLRVITHLGHRLHQKLTNSGSWETVAEDLGYDYGQIKEFSNLASVRREFTPGEIMLRDWRQRGQGRTVFVLCQVLEKSERQDCVEYLQREIYDKLLCMELMVSVTDESGNISYQTVKTRVTSSLKDSLENVLDGGTDCYKLLDPGTDWTTSLAKEFKGRQLSLLRVPGRARVGNRMELGVVPDFLWHEGYSVSSGGVPDVGCGCGNRLSGERRHVSGKPHKTTFHNNFPTEELKMTNIEVQQRIGVGCSYCHGSHKKASPLSETSPLNYSFHNEADSAGSETCLKLPLSLHTSLPSLDSNVSTVSSSSNSDTEWVQPGVASTSTSSIQGDRDTLQTYAPCVLSSTEEHVGSAAVPLCPSQTERSMVTVCRVPSEGSPENKNPGQFDFENEASCMSFTSEAEEGSMSMQPSGVTDEPLVDPYLEDAEPHKTKGCLYPYEHLQRGLSCPVDFYSMRRDSSDDIDMPVIAEVFGRLPTENKSVQRCSSSVNANVKHSDRNVPDLVRMQSLPPSQIQPTLVKIAEEDIDTTAIDQGSCQSFPNFSDSRKLSTNQYPRAPLLPPRSAHHPYKVISCGKTSRPLLDKLLANDSLFTHYQQVLSGYLGWCPRETEYTVERTFSSVLPTDGYYMIWYIRSKRKLILTISHNLKAVHYRVHTKVVDRCLTYYIFPDTIYKDVKDLFEHHRHNGFVVDQHTRDSRRNTSLASSAIRMKCPVQVDYGPGFSISV